MTARALALSVGVFASVVTAAACGSSAASSLSDCSFEDPCANAAERCYVSQVCAQEITDGGTADNCGAIEGDLKCHRLCEGGTGCAAGEQCQEVQLANRSEVVTVVELCFP